VSDDAALCTAEQLGRFRERLRYAYDHVPFYRERYEAAGLDPAGVETYADLVGVPPITKSEVIADQELRPPFGGQLARPAEELHRVFCNAGSLYLWFTEQDLDAIGALFAHQFETMGVRPTDVVDVSSNFHWLMAGTNMDLALRRTGAAVVPGGPGMSELRLKIMREVGITVLEAFTPYAEELATRFEQHGIDPARDLKVRLLTIGGELRQREARERLESAWGGAAVREFYGVSEAGMLAAECFEVGDGMHLSREVLVEIVDPDTGAHVPPEEGGEIVTTELYRSAQRFIRYRTGDITEGVDFAPCACGRTTPRLRRILGRTGDIARVKGLFVAPAVVDQLVRARFGAARWQVVVDRPGTIDTMSLQVEADEAVLAGLSAALVQDVKGSIGLTCEVAAIPPGTLAHDAAPIVDRREFR
jgi:phenylacetate-CoA ligase